VRNRIRLRLASILALMFALAFGSMLKAGSGGRSGESISASGAFAVNQTPDRRQVPLDAIYWIDYRTAKLYSTTPELSKTTANTRMVSEIAVRELIVDFKLPPGVAPHFLMNTASLGALGGGSSALFVVETTTKQLAIYWCYPKTTGLNAKPEFELIQVRPYRAQTSRPDETLPVEAISASGPIFVQMTPDKTQVPLDAVYWLESNAESAFVFTAIPEVRKTVSSTQMVGEVASRNLGADFKLKSGVTPHFLISTPSLGAPAMGMAALFVMETTTKQLGIYRAYPSASTQGSKPIIELLEIKPYDQEQLPPLPQTN